MERDPPPRDRLRLFFALVPHASLLGALAALARDVAARAHGRPVAAPNIHLTLAFLGDVAKETVPVLQAMGDALPRERFPLVLDCIGGFRASGVAWVGASEMAPALAVLQRSLAQSLAAGGFPVDARPFQAHVTIARKCSRLLRERLDPPVEWRVDRLDLVASTLAPGGSVYRALASWALSEPEAGGAAGTA